MSYDNKAYKEEKAHWLSYLQSSKEKIDKYNRAYLRKYKNFDLNKLSVQLQDTISGTWLIIPGLDISVFLRAIIDIEVIPGELSEGYLSVLHLAQMHMPGKHKNTIIHIHLSTKRIVPISITWQLGEILYENIMQVCKSPK